MTCRRALFGLAVFIVFAFALYADNFTCNTFGPELPLFYFYTDGLSFTQTLRSQTYTSLKSYRPTSSTATNVQHVVQRESRIWRRVCGGRW